MRHDPVVTRLVAQILQKSAEHSAMIVTALPVSDGNISVIITDPDTRRTVDLKITVEV